MIRHALCLAVLATAAAAQSFVQLDIDGNDANDRFGTSGAALGDIDGDGIGDIAIGAYLDDDAASNAGVVHLLSGFDGSVIDLILGTNSGDELGTAVASIGDLNGDGIGEIAVGAPRDDTAAPTAGSVRIVDGATRATITTLFGAITSRYGTRIAGGGDVNADGTPDFVVGAYLGDVNGNNSGSAFVHSGADFSVIHAFHGDAADDVAGSSVAILDDLNGDGHAEVLVGHRDANVTAFNDGRARVYCGATGVIMHDHATSSSQNNAHFGESAAALDDLDGDGIGEYAVGSPAEVVTFGAGVGRVRIYSGATGAVFRLVEIDESWVDSLGTSLANAGDVDGDGVGDYVVGGRYDDIPLIVADAGRAYVFSGASGSLVLTHDGDVNHKHTGAMVAAAGDVNGDGFAEVLVGSPLADSAGTATGAAWMLGLGGAVAYGTPDLALFWQPSIPAAIGSLVVTAGTPAAPGVLVVGTAATDITLGVPPIPVYVEPTSVFLQIPFSFDGAGVFALPGSLSVPAAAGLHVYLQAADLAGYPRVSNGLELVLLP